MMIIDIKSKEKISNKNLNAFQPMFKSLKGYEEQKNGILRIAPEAMDSAEEHRTMQEYHNANHSLYYFSMMVEGIIRGRVAGTVEEKVARLVAHMMSLREFIDEKTGLNVVISGLLVKSQSGSIDTFHAMCRFIYENWEQICLFAEIYGQRDKCFSADKYKKVRDVATGRQFIRVWYWESRVNKFWMELKKLAKKVSHG